MARQAPISPEINLVPMMNLVTILIPFLLMSTAFSSAAVIDVNARAVGDPTTDSEPTERPSIAVTDQGFVFTAADGAVENLPCPLGCSSVADYDLVGLQAQLGAHKDRVPSGTELELLSGEEVPYELLIAVMDVTRTDGSRKLYPELLFGTLH